MRTMCKKFSISHFNDYNEYGGQKFITKEGGKIKVNWALFVHFWKYEMQMII